MPYYLTAAHTGAARIGLELSMLPVAIGIAAPIAGRLVNGGARDRLLTGGGLVLTAIGLLVIALRHDTTGLLAGLALAGLGLGAFTPANNAGVMSASPAGHAGAVGGVLNMSRGFGTALGVAVAGALYTAVSGSSHGVSSDVAARGLTAAMLTLACLALATGVTLLLARGRASTGSRAGDRNPRSRRITPRVRALNPE